MIKIKFWLHFYRLPFSFSQSLIMQKLKGTAFLVYGITFCNDVIYACILVKILNMVTDFCLTYSHAGEVCLHFWEWFFFSLRTDLPYEFSFILFTISFTEERKGSIYNKSERKEMLWKLLYSVSRGQSPALEEQPYSMQCLYV